MEKTNKALGLGTTRGTKETLMKRFSESVSHVNKNKQHRMQPVILGRAEPIDA